MPPSDAATLDAKFRHGLALHQRGRLADAQRAYQDVLRDQPAHHEALHFLGVLAVQTGRPDLAIDLIGRAIALRPDYAAAYNNRGNAFRDLGRPEPALADYDRAIALKPDHAEAFDNRGNALRDLGRAEQAVASHDRAIALKPDAAGAHNNRGNALRDLGRLDDALASYDRAIALNPTYAAAWHNRGVTLADVGRHDDALASFDRAIALRPAHADAHRGRAAVLWDLHRPDDALASYDQTIALRPDDAGAWSNRGVVLAGLGRHADAIASYDRAIALRPDLAEALNNRGNAERELGRVQAALASHDAALALRPDFAEAHNNRGIALMSLGRAEDALAAHDRAIALKPDHAGAHYGRGTALTELGRLEAAVASFDRAIELRSDHTETFNNRAAALSGLGFDQAALDSYATALTLKPNLAAAHSGLGTVLLQIGRLDEARRSFERAIECEPKRALHYMFLTRATKLTADSPHLRAMRVLAEDIDTLSEKDRIDLHFALGQALSDIGEHEAAFQHQMAGNTLRRRTIAYDEPAVLAQLERTRTIFSAAFIRSRPAAGDPSDAPVFIVGMPRSGSTLVEQMLASHPRVFGAGEPDALTDMGQRIGLFSNTRPFPESVPIWTDTQMRDLAGRYVRHMRDLAPGAGRIVDKTLSNFRYVGLIAMLLPNARVVHICRDPIDTCLSCFSIQFKLTEFSYDLGELGRVHAASSRLMAHWHQVLPPGMLLRVNYEDLVENFEAEARRIVAHCGLDWDPACLRFHETERPVRTASVVQVRQPLFRDGLHRWRPDETTLKPLLDALRDHPFPAPRR